jgi:FtsH-binding integral membrane protein
MLLAWVGIGGRLALIGSACTWLWYALRLPNEFAVFWVLVIVPLGVCAALRLAPTLRQHWRNGGPQQFSS